MSEQKEQGVAISLISPQDEGLLSDIEVNMKVEIEERTLEDFVATDALAKSTKKNKKPRHRKNRVRKEKEA